MKPCCPLLPAPQKLSVHHLLTAGTLAEPESSLPFRERCSSIHGAAQPCAAIPLLEIHVRQKELVAQFSEDHPWEGFQPCTSLHWWQTPRCPNFTTHLHTQHLVPVPSPHQPPALGRYFRISSFQPCFGLWTRSRLLTCKVVLSAVLHSQLRKKKKSQVWYSSKMSGHNPGYNPWRR